MLIAVLTGRSESWKTKPTDRFVLRWIKLHLSAPVTVRVAKLLWVSPGMVTVFAAALGVTAGVVFAVGVPWAAAVIAAAAQVCDGVDGQLSRLSGRESRAGAYLDSVLDRYADGAMVLGALIYVVTLPVDWPSRALWLVGALAVVGSNAVSYSAARAEALGIDMDRPTRASKGTRMSVLIVSAAGTLVWPAAPLVALLYLAVHPNLAVL